MPFRICLLLLLCLQLSACESSEREATAQAPESPVENEAQQPTEVVGRGGSVSAGSALCSIDGKAWTYEEVSAFTNQDRKTGEQLAYLTFRNHEEAIQLHYNVATQVVTQLIIKLRPETASGVGSANYNWNPNLADNYPDTEVSGNITVGKSMLSGTARIVNLNISAGSSLYQDESYRQLTVEDLQFSGVPYDDHTAMLEGLRPTG